MRKIFTGLLYIGIMVVLVVVGSVLVVKYGCGVPVVKGLVSDSCEGPFGNIRQISELSTAVSTNQVIIEETDAGGLLQGALPGFLRGVPVPLVPR